MRAIFLLLIFLGSIAFAHAEEKIVKVLPFFLDAQNQIAKSPSLFDRDAYQVYLRDHTNDVSGIRYDVLCKTETPSKLRLELRGISETGAPKLKTLEADVANGSFNNWTKIKFAGDEYKNFGSIIAWRATLLDGTNEISQQKSFLW